MRQELPCPCGNWTFREIGLFTGLAASERYCPRCERRMLLVFRGPDHLATVPLGGRNEGRIGSALEEAGLSVGEVKLLVTVAELMRVDPAEPAA